MILNMTGGAGSSGKSDIIVYAPTGSTVYIENQEGQQKTTGEKNGVWTFKGCGVGTWTVHASLGDQSATSTVEITEEGQLMRYEVTISYVKIYGIQRDITQASPEWVRTDDAVGFEAVASVGTQAGHSDFDACYPWSGIHRETLSTGDVMVKIPKFWFKRWRDGNVEHIQIADAAAEGFNLHPAFNHAGVPQDCVYIGAYKTSSNNKSVSGAESQVNQTRAAMRTNAENKGIGWALIDVSSLSAVFFLYLVEFASNNADEKIGQGCVGTSSASTGTCDNVPGLTGRPSGTDGRVDIVYRGMEGLWGSLWEWLDGINWNNGTYYVCNNPGEYNDTENEKYEMLSFSGATSWNAAFIKEMGFDSNGNEHILAPAVANSANSSTFFCDGCWGKTGNMVCNRGGSRNYESTSGLFAMAFTNSPSQYAITITSRLMYIPQEVTA